MRANAACNLTTVTLTQDLAYILIRFLWNTGSRECFSTLTPTSNSGKIFFSTLTSTPDSGIVLFSTLTPRKNLRLPWLRRPTLQHWLVLASFLLAPSWKFFCRRLWAQVVCKVLNFNFAYSKQKKLFFFRVSITAWWLQEDVILN